MSFGTSSGARIVVIVSSKPLGVAVVGGGSPTGTALTGPFVVDGLALVVAGSSRTTETLEGAAFAVVRAGFFATVVFALEVGGLDTWMRVVGVGDVVVTGSPVSLSITCDGQVEGGISARAGADVITKNPALTKMQPLANT
jgi:hypothetical protein